MCQKNVKATILFQLSPQFFDAPLHLLFRVLIRPRLVSNTSAQAEYAYALIVVDHILHTYTSTGTALPVCAVVITVYVQNLCRRIHA